MNSDVLIIGGGVIGLSIARDLNKRGIRGITIVDRGPIGHEASWAAAGMLAPNIEADANDDFHRFGVESLHLFPDFSEQLLEETGIDIELDRTGTLFLSDQEEDEEVQHSLLAAFNRQSDAGIRVQLLERDEMLRLEPSIAAWFQAALLYPDDWQVDNRKLVEALRRYAEINGIRIAENTEVREILIDDLKITGARTADGDLRAGTTIIATGAWTSLIKFADATLPIEVKPIRGQMIGFRVEPRVIRHVLHTELGYLVPRADGRILVGATVEDVGFENAVTQEGLESLVVTALGMVPSLGLHPVADRWSGLRPFVTDGLPLIGELPGYDNVLIATGHYRNGILLAPKTAEIIGKKLAQGVESPHLRTFGVDRFSHSDQSNLAASSGPRVGRD